MTMPYERRKSVERTRDLLAKILSHEYENGENYHDLWHEARSCLKHYPSEYYMDEARELAPEVFGDWQDDEKLTEVVVGGIVHTANEGYYYARVVGSDSTTINYTLRKKT